MRTLIITFFLLVGLNATSQDYLTRNGSISFSSHTPLEDVQANNNEVVSLINSATGAMDFKVALKSFHFKKQAMEDHFNDPEYIDSEKYPKAGFSGKITNLADVNFTKDGTYDVTVEGNLTIKDVTKPVSIKGTIIVGNGKVTAKAAFSVKRKEYHVIGESFTESKIEQDIHINVNCVYDKR